mmetsp:Transcript_18157/g.57014  ORF Transcript_18157/g.57014 Transcript_18157/m.57014 type:complete len:455 (+) Transcript_18157:23-1387(+)
MGARERWRRLAAMAREELFEVDPLASEDLVSRPSERVVRQRWISGAWVEDSGTVKVAASPFAEGSMRVCYYAKKMSSRGAARGSSKHAEWAYQRNYVLKTYKASVSGSCRKMLEDDVVTQAESKALARRYNAKLRALLKAGKFDRRSPKPMKYKCVDMLEACLVRFPDRAGEPCFLMEAFVAGDFRKHNDNFGFVSGVVDDDETPWRATPQAFSHFTFCETAGDRIVVDVQGVGDLFTDPQIHTRDGVGFGVGNGGGRGLALFFATHRCNRICKCMGLLPFDRPLPDLEAALTADDLDRRLADLVDPRALGARLPPATAAALADLLADDARRDRPPSVRPPPVLREVHKTLGFMLLSRDKAVDKVASPSAALFHLAAAALADEPSALRFLTSALDAHRAAARHHTPTLPSGGGGGRRRRQRQHAPSAADRATQAAALAMLAVALHHISSVLLRS